MICVVEDDAAIRELELYALTAGGFQVRGFETGGEFLAYARTEKPELLLLDVMLPGENGLSVLRAVRASGALRGLPVIMATARGEEYDKVTALDGGADDYLVKPFGMLEMVSRVKAVLRRFSRETVDSPLVLGGIRLDPLAHTVTADGEGVLLTLKEFRLLQQLMERPDTVHTREMLLSRVWGTDYDGETRTVDAHVKSLRQKLGRCGELVATVRGVGYRMEESR